MKVNEFRISSIWVEGVPQVIAAKGAGRLGDIVDSASYAGLVASLIADRDSHDLLTLPWPRMPNNAFPKTNLFWKSYLFDGLNLRGDSDPAARAWGAAVPLLRKVPPARIIRRERTFVESWYHPHGVATAVTAHFKGSFDPKTMRDAATAFLRGPIDVTWTGASAPVPAKLDAVAPKILDTLRAEAFGSVNGGSRDKPYRIVTIVRATPDDTDETPADDAFVRAAFSIVGGDTSAVTADRDVYVLTHGLVIYNRDLATATYETHTLGCLHRNATIASMQVASLVQAAKMMTAAGDDADGVLPARVKPYARRIAGLLGRINGNTNGTNYEAADENRTTYDKRFLRRQIKDANANGSIDVLRNRLGMPSLAVDEPRQDT